MNSTEHTENFTRNFTAYAQANPEFAVFEQFKAACTLLVILPLLILSILGLIRGYINRHLLMTIDGMAVNILIASAAAAIGIHLIEGLAVLSLFGINLPTRDRTCFIEYAVMESVDFVVGWAFVANAIATMVLFKKETIRKTCVVGLCLLPWVMAFSVNLGWLRYYCNFTIEGRNIDNVMQEIMLVNLVFIFVDYIIPLLVGIILYAIILVKIFNKPHISILDRMFSKRCLFDLIFMLIILLLRAIPHAMVILTRYGIITSLETSMGIDVLSTITDMLIPIYIMVTRRGFRIVCKGFLTPDPVLAKADLNFPGRSQLLATQFSVEETSMEPITSPDEVSVVIASQNQLTLPIDTILPDRVKKVADWAKRQKNFSTSSDYASLPSSPAEEEVHSELQT